MDSTGSIDGPSTTVSDTSADFVSQIIAESSESDNQTETTSPSSKPLGVGSETANPVNPSYVGAYSESSYVVINSNQSNFSASELTTTGYEKYSELDSIGRCGVALASCGKDTMHGANETRGSISSIKPSGWVQAKYSGIFDGYL